MKSAIVFALLVAAAVAVPLSEVVVPRTSYDQDATVIQNESNNIGVGDFAYSAETSNGIKVQAQGTLRASPDGDILEVRGSYSYPGDDGAIYTVTYVSNENGFQPSGAHIA